MSLEDPTMGATFTSWTSAAEHGAADKMPAWGVPGETPEEGEWPARDRVPRLSPGEYVTDLVVLPTTLNAPQTVPFMVEAKVTPEMIEAATNAYENTERQDDTTWSDTLAAIYRAMHAAAPVPLVSDAEIALTRERDEARAERDAALAWNRAADETISILRDELDQARSDIKGFRSVRDTYLDKMDRDAATIASLRAELMALRAELAETVSRAGHAELECAELRAELMAAHDRLAKFTAQSTAETVAPDPIANAILPRETERRRIGVE